LELANISNCTASIKLSIRHEQNAARWPRYDFRNTKQKYVDFDELLFYPHSIKIIIQNYDALLTTQHTSHAEKWI